MGTLLATKKQINEQKFNWRAFVQENHLDDYISAQDVKKIYYPDIKNILQSIYTSGSIYHKKDLPQTFHCAEFITAKDAFIFFENKIKTLEFDCVYALFSPAQSIFIDSQNILSSNLPALSTSLKIAKKICKRLIENNTEHDEIFMALISINMQSGLLLDSSLGNYEGGKNPDQLCYEVTSW